MDIHHIMYFVEVAQQKSFTKAAQALFISQPTISKIIKNLEDELGVTLFYRSAKQIELTDAGKAIFKQALNIVTTFKALPTELSDVINLKKGSIKIGLPPMVGARFFPKIIGEFKKIYPYISIQLREVGSKRIETEVDEGDLDVGVVMLPVKEDTFNALAFARDPLMVILPPGHRLAGQPKVNLIDLQHEPFILFNEDFALHSHILNNCLEHGFEPNIVCTSSQWDLMMEMVSANLGIAFLPQEICKSCDNRRITSSQLSNPEIYWHLAIIWSKDRYLSFAAREFLKFTNSWFKKE